MESGEFAIALISKIKNVPHFTSLKHFQATKDLPDIDFTAMAPVPTK